MKRLALVAGAAAALAPAAGAAFVLLGPIWPDGSAPLDVGAIGGGFRNALLDAADAWEDASDFEFRPSFGGDGACDRDAFGRGPLEEGAEFHDRDCDGFALGFDVLAVTQYETQGGRFAGVGLVFNEDLDWELYAGPWRDDEPEFFRVALHELGHWLGLDHEDGAPSIMSTFAGDTDELRADDVAGVRALYGPDPDPPPPPPGPEPLDPAAACRRDQLRAAAALCRRELACEAKRAGAPAEDPAGLARDACLASAAERFARQYGRAEARAAEAGAACPSSADAAAAAALVRDPAAALAAGLLAGSDEASRPDARLRERLLRAAGAACDAALRAEARFVREGDAERLAKRRARARAGFLGKAEAAIARAAGAGVAYAGTPPPEGADLLDALADAVAAAAAGS